MLAAELGLAAAAAVAAGAMSDGAVAAGVGAAGVGAAGFAGSALVLAPLAVAAFVARGFEVDRAPVDVVLRFVVLAVLPVSSSVTALSPFCVSQVSEKSYYTADQMYRAARMSSARK